MAGAYNTTEKSGLQFDVIFNRYDAAIEELRAKIKNVAMPPKELLQETKDLQFLGQELKQKVAKISHPHDRLEQVINAIQIPLLFLDKELKIQLFTPEVKNIFDEAEFDKDKLFSAVLKPSAFNKLNKQIQNFFNNPVRQEVELHQKKHDEWYLTRILPYSAAGNGVDGIIITFLNITKDKEYERRLNELNRNLQLEIKKQNKQVKKLASELIAAEQKERKRIARLLHNDLQQQLFSSQTKAKLLNDDLPAEFTEEISGIIDQIGRSLQLTQQLVVSLSPPNIENNNLYKGINWLCKYVYNFHGLLVQTKGVRHIKLENNDVLVLILQMIQELLFNVVKHAGVNEARIITQQEDGMIQINVVDEGKGFNEDELDPVVNFGLSQTKEKLKLIGGDLLIDSTPGKGTDVYLSVPGKRYVKTAE